MAEVQQSPLDRKHVVIIGAGFGGLSAAKGLADAPVDVIVIDRHNYHLFQPLLYQVATAGLSPADIAAPIRSVLSRQTNATVILAEVAGVDTATRTVQAENRRVPYDLADYRHRRQAQLLRPRRLGEVCARPEAHRRRHGAPSPYPAGV